MLIMCAARSFTCLCVISNVTRNATRETKTQNSSLAVRIPVLGVMLTVHLAVHTTSLPLESVWDIADTFGRSCIFVSDEHALA